MSTNRGVVTKHRERVSEPLAANIINFLWIIESSASILISLSGRTALAIGKYLFERQPISQSALCDHPQGSLLNAGTVITYLNRRAPLVSPNISDDGIQIW